MSWRSKILRGWLFSGLAISCLAIGLSADVSQAADALPPSRAAQAIDASLAKELFQPASADATPVALAPRADDATFLRRVTLDLVGRIPTPEEITAHTLDPAQDKRLKVINRLLASPEFGQNWARYWRDVILYRRTEERGLIVSQSVVDYLADQFNSGAGWDQIAQDFITASGDVRENGATAVLIAQMADADEVAAETSRIFMGVQIQCAQCHDHPTDRWKREQFHELAAFFPRVTARPVRDGDQRSFEIAGRDNAPRMRRKKPNAKPRGNLEHFMPDLKDPSAQGKLMQPVFFATGQKLEQGQTDADRRESLATWMTARDNPWFAKAYVNRIWSELVGEGFYEPVDDLGPDRTCSAPKTLDMLAAQFVRGGHDVKWLYRTIMSTEAYQRESRPPRNEGEIPFTANRPQPLRADQLFDALSLSLGMNPMERGAAGRGYGAALRGPRGEFMTTFGYDPSVRRDEVTGSIPQALILMNSPLINRSLEARNRRAMLGELLTANAKDEDATLELYLRCLSREPQADELAACLEHVKTGDRRQAFEDVLWALLNSTEFRYRR